MDEYIKRGSLVSEYDKAMKWLRENSHNHSLSDYIERMAAMQTGKTMTEAIPAADVVPARHGRWVEVEVKELAYYKMMIASMRCDQCGRYHNEVYHYGNPTEMAKYCGFCGALMDKDGDGDV